MSESTFEIRKDLSLAATPEQVWRAVATPEGQAGWSPDPYQDVSGLEVTRDEPRRFEVRTPLAPNGGFNAFEYEIVPDTDGTVAFTFRHHGDLGEGSPVTAAQFEAMTGHGWDLYMHNLAAVLEHFPDRSAVFVTGQGPAGSAVPEAYTQVMAALSVEGVPQVGEPIVLRPSGMEPIEGVVDYAQEGISFLGVRAASGLYRFHDNSVMGMPQAYGHYLFDGTPREEAQAAWQAWMESVFA